MPLRPLSRQYGQTETTKSSMIVVPAFVSNGISYATL